MAELKLAWVGRPDRGRWILCDFYDLGSTLVCGKSGTGKSSTVAYLCSQAALQGIRMAVADPHGGEQQSLAAKLGPLAGTYWQPPALTAEASLRLVQRVHGELQRRKERAAAYFERNDRSWSCSVDGDVRLVLVVDELNSLLRRFKKEGLANLLKDIGQEGRKFGVFAILSGQWMTAEAMGSTELRSAFVSAIMHRMSPKMASMITDFPEGAFPLAPGLNRGECYIRLAGRDEPLSGHIPPMGPGDIEEVARVLSDSPPLLRMPMEQPRSEVKVSEATRAALWAERARVVELVMAGNTFGDAAMIVMGRPTDQTGRPRVEGTRVIEEIVREYIRELERSRQAMAV